MNWLFSQLKWTTAESGIPANPDTDLPAAFLKRWNTGRSFAAYHVTIFAANDYDGRTRRGVWIEVWPARVRRVDGGCTFGRVLD